MPPMEINPPETSSDHIKDSSIAFYRSMLRIRRFEETVLDNFSKGLFTGTTHTYIGQEANAVGILANIEPDDIVVSNHRCHGHFLAYGGDMRGLFAELMGKSTGICGGRGGSQHLHWRNFYSNGILGGTAPIAVGMSLAEKYKNNNNVTVIFIGDGTLGEGVLYESLNMAGLWSVPILFVLENNQIAQTTPIELNLSGEIPSRFSAFGIEVQQLDTSNVNQIQSAAGQLINSARNIVKPQALILNTFRFGPHSKGDDTRPKEEIEQIRRSRDPILLMADRIDPKLISEINDEVILEVAKALDRATADPPA